MKQLKWWLHIVGGFFVFLALVSLPPVQANTVVSGFPDPLGKQATLAFGFPIDTGVMFGLELGLIGLMLIVAPRAPFRALSLVYPIIALEVVKGILNAIDMTRGDNSAGFYITFTTIHLLILVMGVAFLQQRFVRPKRIGIA
jgi:hypothetical protein